MTSSSLQQQVHTAEMGPEGPVLHKPIDSTRHSYLSICILEKIANR